MTLQNRQYFNSIQGLEEAREKMLTVLFDSDEQMMERIYDRDLRLKFGVGKGEHYQHTKYVPKGKSSEPDNFRGFEVVFKGEKNELKKIVKYIEKLDRKNKIYHSHKIK